MQLSVRQIPNALSLSRIPIAAVFLLTFNSTNLRSFWLSMAWLLIALITDLIDGPIARIYSLTTRMGYFIDGLGDKVVYIAILLVIFREDRSRNLLPWLLISREVILYAIRTIEGGSELVLEAVRPISLTYAGLIRLYFLGFFVMSAWPLYNQQSNSILSYYVVFGYLAAMSGYVHIVWLIRLMAEPA